MDLPLSFRRFLKDFQDVSPAAYDCGKQRLTRLNESGLSTRELQCRAFLARLIVMPATWWLPREEADFQHERSVQQST
jgi:hypothetical protein